MLSPPNILNPSSSLKVDAYPDADFAGLYGYEKIVRDFLSLFRIAR